MKNSLFLLLLPLAVMISPSSGKAGETAYGEVFQYRAETIRFSDFELRFLGARRNGFYPGSTTRRLGDIYEFRITDGESEQIVFWSQGTGDIAPAVFEAGGKRFCLELLMSEKFGSMKEGQAVVSIAASSGCGCSP